MPDPDPDDDDTFTCWCGVSGKYEDMFEDDYLNEGCGGLGFLNCYCGGDLCVCHHHGETECPGCDDCDGDEDDACGDYD